MISGTTGVWTQEVALRVCGVQGEEYEEWKDAAQCLAGLVAGPAGRHQARALGRGIAISGLSRLGSRCILDLFAVSRMSLSLFF